MSFGWNDSTTESTANEKRELPPQGPILNLVPLYTYHKGSRWEDNYYQSKEDNPEYIVLLLHHVDPVRLADEDVPEGRKTG